MLTLSFFVRGRLGGCLTFRKPSLEERRLNEASQPAKSNLERSILKRLAVSREDRLLHGCQMAGVDVSRMVPTLGSDLFSMWNGRSSLNGALEGFVLVKRLKRIKLERWH